MSLPNKMTQHPWHGPSPDWDGHTVMGVVEIPKGERCKFEMHKDSGLLILDRVLSTTFEYPINYGFIPGTIEDDGDPLDILILSSFSLPSLCLVRCRVLGMLQMEDRGKLDRKILSVADTDVTNAHIQSLDDLPRTFFSELRHFFEQYTILENKKVIIRDFRDKAEASGVIENCIRDYKLSFS